MKNELFSSGGYRLDIFQLYNWGVFDGTVFTIDCRKESSLLTGANGSGKTTIVDALLSLLVPYTLRFYNQSSGTDRKRDRTEETYVLGAYGNRQDEESSGSRMQSLRTRDTFSVLSGCFVNDGTQSTVSLLQIRYFSGDVLQHVYALTRQRLSLDDINTCLAARGTSIDRAGRWKQIISAAYGTIFFGDSFKKYSDMYSELFGFRSDKALRLFSQTVGLKVLGNLTEFIRTNMLEEIDTAAQFEKLQSNYTKLIQSYNEIRKTKKQLELLEPVIDIGEKWKQEQTEKQRLEDLRDTLPVWYAHTALELLGKQQADMEEKRLSTEAHLQSENMRRDTVQKEIDSLHAALAQNEAARHIKDIADRIDVLTAEENRIQAQRNSYGEKIAAVGLTLPQTEAAFFANRKQTESLRQKEHKTRQTVDARLFEIRTQFNTGNDLMATLKKELASLGTRNSNIPLENIELRAALCRTIRCEETALPFAGELLCVADSEQLWSYAIEKLLHNFALDILVPEQFYTKVTAYVKNNNLHGRIVYLQTISELSLSAGNAPTPNRSTVPGKLLVKQNHPLTDWLTRYVSDHYDYLCTDSTDEISRAGRALSSTGLIKNGIRHEKDDRNNRNGSFVQVLGWDNTQKRRVLSVQLDDAKKQAAAAASDISKLESELNAGEQRVRTLENIAEITSWDSIDTESRAKQIDSLLHEKESLEKKATGIRNLQQQLEKKEQERTDINNAVQKIAGELGVISSSLSGIQGKVAENTAVWNSFCSGGSAAETLSVRIDLLHTEYERLSRPRDISELDAGRNKMAEDISSHINGCIQRINAHNTNLGHRMDDIRNPPAALRKQYGDWSAEFVDLGNDADALDDYTAFYNRLKKDDLPKYSGQFREYLHDTMKTDIVDFREFISNGTQEIKNAISNLNSSLRSIAYGRNPDTHLQLELAESSDIRIRDFKIMLRNATPDALYIRQHDEEREEYLFNQIKTLLDKLQENENDRRFVLDIRNWFIFAAKEIYAGDGTQKNYYQNTASLSGGEKAKLTYTILASAIAYQFGIASESGTGSSFRFVIIDEAFSKSDSFNADYAMKLFEQLDLQLMVITPLDKINIVENYISSLHLTENTGSHDSRLLHMTIESYHNRQRELQQKEIPS